MMALLAFVGSFLAIHERLTSLQAGQSARVPAQRSRRCRNIFIFAFMVSLRFHRRRESAWLFRRRPVPSWVRAHSPQGQVVSIDNATAIDRGAFHPTSSVPLGGGALPFSLGLPGRLMVAGKGSGMRILLVEDDEALAGDVARALREENFAVDVAGNGEDGGHLGSTERYDAAVLDLGLPRIDGLSVLQSWRADGLALPVLILTARDAWSEKVAGFKAGADDYLIKPFRVQELVMRLRALVRRANGHAATRVACGRLVFDAQLGHFELDGLPLRLTAFEWRVLSALMLRKETVLDRRELIDRVYEYDADVDSNSLEVIVGRLRRKIGAAMIRTVRGRGYCLTGEAG